MNKDATQTKDAGLALVLILLLGVYFTRHYSMILPISVVLVFVMTIPVIFKPFAVIWFGFSKYLGIVSSNIILTLLFIIVVVPISLVLRVLRVDPLQLRCWKSNSISAFHKVNHEYTSSDVQHPY